MPDIPENEFPKYYNLNYKQISRNFFMEKLSNYKFTGVTEYHDGTQRWFVNGKLHRVDGPAMGNPNDGTQVWYINGEYHRAGGPAIIHTDGTKYWYQWYHSGKRHRLDGPAIEYYDGSKYWYVDDKEVTEEQCKLLYDIMKLKGLL